MKTKFFLAMLILVFVGTAVHAVDVNGILAQGEYAKEATFDNGNYRLLWSVVGDKLFMAIDAKASGWVAVGFEPSVAMANADMVFGIVDASGAAKCVDAWATGMFGPHPPDVDQGGRDNILSFAGKRSGDRVVFEFSRLLNTGDKFDKVLPATGTVKLIFSYSSSLQFNVKHSKAGSAVIDMGGSK